LKQHQALQYIELSNNQVKDLQPLRRFNEHGFAVSLEQSDRGYSGDYEFSEVIVAVLDKTRSAHGGLEKSNGCRRCH